MAPRAAERAGHGCPASIGSAQVNTAGRETLCTAASHRPFGGTAINTLILLALAVAILVSVVLLIGQLLVRRQREKELWESDGRPDAPERTSDRKAQDRKTAITWGCLIVAVPIVLVLLYTITR